MTVAPGERRLVVQGVVSRHEELQFVLLEESIAGDSNVRLTGRDVPPARPTLAVAGATVTVDHLGPGACTGRTEKLVEQAPAVGEAPTGLYRAIFCGPEIGERLLLRVTTADGRVVTGETVVPGALTRTVSSGGQVARMPMDTLPLMRERDTVRLALTAANGRAMQVEIRRAEYHDDLSLYLFTDSLGIAIPGDLVDPFGQDFRTVFRAGRYYALSVALADTNYYDYVRSVSDPITGRGFLNHLSGGVGVFGSVDVATYVLRVTGTVNRPQEGAYRVAGLAGADSVDLLLECYFDDAGNGRFSAFVDGQTSDGRVRMSGDGLFGIFPGASPRDSNTFQYAFDVHNPTPPRYRRYALTGTRAPDQSDFPVTYWVTDERGATLVRATLTGRQVSGPGPSPSTGGIH